MLFLKYSIWVSKNAEFFLIIVFVQGGSPTPHPFSSRPHFVCKLGREEFYADFKFIEKGFFKCIKKGYQQNHDGNMLLLMFINLFCALKKKTEWIPKQHEIWHFLFFFIFSTIFFYMSYQHFFKSLKPKAIKNICSICVLD